MKLQNFFAAAYAALFVVSGSPLLAIPATNLFDPYDILLVKPFNKDRCFDFYVASESAFKTRAFQADPDDMNVLYKDSYGESANNNHAFSREVDVLKIWQNEQNVFNSLYPDQFMPSNFISVQGKLSVPANLMFAVHCSLPCDLMVGVYLPYYFVELKNVQWNVPASATRTTEQINQQLNYLETAGKFDLRSNWQQSGIGDLTALVWWARGFPQAKQWLKLVNVSVRGGLTFPTGKDTNIEHIFGLPLGNNAGVGFLFGGTLELGLFHHLKFGLDAEFLQLLGSQKMRRYKHQMYETDLVFTEPFGDLYLDQVTRYPESKAFEDPGFLQHYTIYASGYDLCGANITLAYQHKRQHENALTLDTARVNPEIIDIAESLQDWTMHNIVCMLDYKMDFKHISPMFTAFVKYGFNGKRVISCNTIGAQVSLDF